MKKLYNRHSFLAGLLFCMAVVFGIGIGDLLVGNKTSAIVEFCLVTIFVVYLLVVQIMRKHDMDNYLSLLISRGDNVSHNAVTMLPIPMAVLSVDGFIMWYNDPFAEIIAEDGLYNKPICEVMQELKWNEILKSEEIAEKCEYNDRLYNISGRIVHNGDDISVLLYFEDMTDFVALQQKYENERTVFGIVVVDNYDDLFGRMDDIGSQQASAIVNRNIIAWAEETKGIIKRLERDRYLVMFEKSMLPECIEKKFDVLEKVRQAGESLNMPVSVSIGIGIGDSLLESEEYARSALSMAEGRGGDQAVVKDAVQYSFYGGKTREYEKSTRVKTRAFATALRDFIKNTDSVFLMGHKTADYDCFGAAIALAKVAIDMGKKAYIVYDNSPAVEELTEKLRELPEYEGVLISADYAKEIAVKNSVTIVLDTHRLSMLPSPELTEICDRVVLIDHHRRSTEFLPKVSLMYHEPYASSTCEMVAEILQYIDDKRKVGAFEAKSLYIGILMDTKNFMVKTGVRTFEAASFLRKYGVDTTEVKKMLAMDKDEYMYKIKIMENMELYDGNIAIAYTEEKYHNMRVVASTACDDLLGIKGVKAAFVVYLIDTAVYISARSLGDANVQLICEKLGGGGHMTVAGAQLKGKTIEETKQCVKAAIDEYNKESITETERK